jgi:cardiolipin synthase
MPINNYTNTSNESIELVYSGTDYFSRLEHIIQNSKYEIHMQFYIFKDDFIGNKILEELKKAADRRVKIYILLDGFGSFSFPKEVITELGKKGIQFRFFSPLFSKNSLYIGRRLHHKVVVSDANVILIGGINISNNYFGKPTKEPWLDYAVQVTDTIVSKKLQLLCRDLFFKKRFFSKKKIETVLNITSETKVSILQNDWLKLKNEIYNEYINSIINAEKEIIIVASYFLPGRRLYKALKKAAKNKVNIKLILSGNSDIPLSRRATFHIYNKLLKYNIELYEWNKTLLHGKAAVIDNYWTTIGSFNLNNLSAYGSLEMNIAIKSETFSKNYSNHLKNIITDCQKITMETNQKRNNLLSNFKNCLSYWTSKFILEIVTYIPHKRYKKMY